MEELNSVRIQTFQSNSKANICLIYAVLSEKPKSVLALVLSMQCCHGFFPIQFFNCAMHTVG